MSFQSDPMDMTECCISKIEMLCQVFTTATLCCCLFVGLFAFVETETEHLISEFEQNWRFYPATSVSSHINNKH